MTTVAESAEATTATAEDGSRPTTNQGQDTAMEEIKAEDAPDNTKLAVSNGENKPAASANEVDADDDSEAETLIQSPEKRRALAEGVPIPDSNKRPDAKDQVEKKEAAPDSGRKSRKRKRVGDDGEYEASSKASTPQSSPLSSPVILARSHDRDSDGSNRSAFKSTKILGTKRNGAKADSESTDGTAQPKARRRRPSDLLPPASKHPLKGFGDAGGSERRETRSATYPRHSSEERSPSPRPTSRRDHRRGFSTQLTSGEFERKKRGRPPQINTRRNTSADRARSSSDDSSSPSRQRPGLQKFSSHDQDNMSPAKVTGPRKWRDKNGRTFLSRACNNDDLERAKICHQERPEDLNLPDNAGNTPLQIAALEGFVDIVRFLLEKGAEVDTRNIDKETPLIDAVENGHLEVVKLLLDYGANPRLGNAKGDEPYELVHQDDQNYKIIRKLIADAKDHDFSKWRRSNDNNKDDSKEERDRASSRAASAASPRDSPPVLGPRSPPAVSSRRRTGRSESTRNDLLWQANTPENLRLLAGKGNVQGVIYVLNILQKAEPEAVIAAAKAGHEEVLQYLLAMGDADPDPDPVPELKPLFNTPMLAAIGRGHLDVIKLLVEQSGFNPTRKWKGKSYFEIAADRKGANWQKEYDILKSAFEKHGSVKLRKASSPRKTRDQDRPKEKRVRRSTSPFPSNLQQSSSPSLTHQSLPEKSPKSVMKERKHDGLSPQQQARRKASTAIKESNDAVAVTSDQEQTVADRKKHKHRRSQSDLPVPVDLEADIAHRRRRLVTGKEHRRRKSGTTDANSIEGSEVEIDVKREGDTASFGLKRTRSSVSPGPAQTKDAISDRLTSKKRRTVQESSPEESRPRPIKAATAEPEGSKDVEMADVASDAKVFSQVEETSQQQSKSDGVNEASESKSQAHVSGATPQDSKSREKDGSPTASMSDKPKSKQPSQVSSPAPSTELDKEKSDAERRKLEEEQKAAEEARRLEEERIAAERLEAERVAAEKAAAEKQAAEKAAAERRAAEEAAAKRQAEEEALARKKEEEERQERIRRELEDTKRRQEEQIRQQQLEIERRRREALPGGLAKASLLLETGDPEYSRWLTRFLPLFTVRTEQLDPECPSYAAHELWVPNWQVAVLLATKDLNLRNYTSFEKREATPNHRDRMWRVGRLMLTFDFYSSGYNTPIKQANDAERRERPKFFALAELFWVKVCVPVSIMFRLLTFEQLSDLEDQVIRHPHLSGLKLSQQNVCLRPQHEIIAEGEAKERQMWAKQHSNGIPLSSSSSSPPMVNGIHAFPIFEAGPFGNGRPRF